MPDLAGRVTFSIIYTQKIHYIQWARPTNHLLLEISKSVSCSDFIWKDIYRYYLCPAHNVWVPNTKPSERSHKLSKAKCCSFSLIVQLELELMTFVHWGSQKEPKRPYTSLARTAKWYVEPDWNWVSVQAIGSGRAFTSPIFFQCCWDALLLELSWWKA